MQGYKPIQTAEDIRKKTAEEKKERIKTPPNYAGIIIY